jgi:NTF2 fold immunity protein
VKLYLAIIALSLSIAIAGQSSNNHEEFAYARHEMKSSRSFVPKNGYVPDKDTAIAIAYAVSVPVYGKESVDAEKPFRAEVDGGKWIVLGTLHGQTSGGTLIVQIDRNTGTISYLNHSM